MDELKYEGSKKFEMQVFSTSGSLDSGGSGFRRLPEEVEVFNIEISLKLFRFILIAFSGSSSSFQTGVLILSLLTEVYKTGVLILSLLTEVYKTGVLILSLLTEVYKTGVLILSLLTEVYKTGVLILSLLYKTGAAEFVIYKTGVLILSLLTEV